MDEARLSRLQAQIERVSLFFGSSVYFVSVTFFVVAWIAVNEFGLHHGWRHVDEPPFFWLQGIVSSNALLLTIAVLIRQTRMAKLATHRAHLDLQINLLTEQKVSKILAVVDNLQREIRGGGERPDDHAHDAEVAEMTTPTNPDAILKAIKEKNNDR